MKHAGTHPTRSIGFLSRLHDGELSEAEQREFAAHAAECGDCAAAAAEFERILALYRQAQAEPADSELAGRISRRLDERLRWRPPVRYVRLEIDLVWASVVATCLIAVLTLYTFRPSRRHPAPVSMVAETNAAPSPESLTPGEPTVSKRGSAHRLPARAPTPPRSAAGLAPEASAPAAPAKASEPVLREEVSNQPREQARQSAAESGAAPASPPAAFAPDARDETRVSSTVLPVVIHRFEPVLPEASRRILRSEGPFRAEAVITENGDVTSVRISPPAPPGLERPIVEALRRWKYKPAQRDGRPIAAHLSVVIYVNPN